MGVSLLKNLGVDRRIIQALQKTYGEDLKQVEFEKEAGDLKLLVQCRKDPTCLPHVLTIRHFFEDKIYDQVAETAVKYSTEHYNCRDVIALLPDDNSGRGNVKINGHEIHLGDSMFHLLRSLAKELKKNEGGWVYVQDLADAGILPSEGYQPFNRLRSAIAGYLLDKNPKVFIESNGRKQYRISTDPSNVEIVEEAKK